MAYGANKYNLGWAVRLYGSVNAAVEAAEKMAVIIFNEEDREDEPEDYEPSLWAAEYFPRVRHERHMGDCSEARSWECAPATCPACVYDDYIMRAWKRLQTVTGN